MSINIHCLIYVKIFRGDFSVCSCWTNCRFTCDHISHIKRYYRCVNRDTYANMKLGTQNKHTVGRHRQKHSTTCSPLKTISSLQTFVVKNITCMEMEKRRPDLNDYYSNKRALQTCRALKVNPSAI